MRGRHNLTTVPVRLTATPTATGTDWGAHAATAVDGCPRSRTRTDAGGRDAHNLQARGHPSPHVRAGRWSRMSRLVSGFSWLAVHRWLAWYEHGWALRGRLADRPSRAQSSPKLYLTLAQALRDPPAEPPRAHEGSWRFDQERQTGARHMHQPLGEPTIASRRTSTAQ